MMQIVTFIFAKKLGRFYKFPTFFHLSDFLLFVSSAYMINWIDTVALDDVNLKSSVSIDMKDDAML